MASTSSAPNVDLSVEHTLQLQDQPLSDHEKLHGLAWWDSIGSPKYVVAPMVDQSELAWRILSRLHGATLAYTPMFHAALFSNDRLAYASEQFDTSPESLEGVAPYDRPLVVQFCANDPDLWLAAAKKVVGRCDAVDLNLGCPQGIAKRGRYGAFLMEEWDLIKRMISHLHKSLSIPVIAKLRVFPELERTLAYASHVFHSGAQLVTVHGRVREAKGQLAGYASWPKIAAVTRLLSPRIPVLANGGLPSANQVEPCLRETGAVGVMSAEGNLYNPMIFSPSNAKAGREYLKCLPENMQLAILACNEQFEPGTTWDLDAAAYAPSTWLAAQYLAIVRTLPSTQTALSAIKSHLFKLFRPVWASERHLDTREMLGKAGGLNPSATYAERVQQYEIFVQEMLKRFKQDLEEGNLPENSFRPLTQREVDEIYNGVIPYSHAQPYMRVMPAQVEDKPDPVQQVEEISAKRLRGESAPTVDEAPKRTKTEEDSAPPASAVKTTQPCVQAAATPACTNARGARCSNGACIRCCPLVPGAHPCEFHESKLKRQAEQRSAKREQSRKRKEWKRGRREEKKGQNNGIEATEVTEVTNDHSA